MNLNKYVSECIIDHPNLYYYSTFKRSQLEVLDSIFNTIGNGMAWHTETGTMVELEWVESNKFVSNRWVCWGKIYKPIYEGEIITSDNFNRVMKKLLPNIDPPTSEFTPYGTLYGGSLHYLPNNIEKSWLEGTNIIYNAIYEFYVNGNDDNRNDVGYKGNNKADNTKQLNSLKIIKKRLDVLNKEIL